MKIFDKIKKSVLFPALICMPIALVIYFISTKFKIVDEDTTSTICRCINAFGAGGVIGRMLSSEDKKDGKDNNN